MPDRVEAKRVIPTGSESVSRNQASQSRRHFFVFPQLQAVAYRRCEPLALRLNGSRCTLGIYTRFPLVLLCSLLAPRCDKRVLDGMYALLGTSLPCPCHMPACPRLQYPLRFLNVLSLFPDTRRYTTPRAPTGVAKQGVCEREKGNQGARASTSGSVTVSVPHFALFHL